MIEIILQRGFVVGQAGIKKTGNLKKLNTQKPYTHKSWKLISIKCALIVGLYANIHFAVPFFDTDLSGPR